MTDAFTTFLSATGSSRIPVAKLGRYKDPRYGDFAITASMVASWQRLLSSHFGGRVAVDYDHNTDKAGPTGSEAAAWITSLNIDADGQVWGDVEWTPEGEQAVKDKRYLFVSPTFGDAKDEQGRTLGPALLRAALTNNPFLRSMPAITLDACTRMEDERESERPDSRPAMTPLAPIAKALGLDENADEAKILEAVAEIQKPAEKQETKTLEAQAAEQGKVLLDSTQVADLTRKAQAGEDAAKTLAERDFADAIKLARSEGRLDAAPESEERLKKLYALDAATTLEHIASLPKVVNLADTTTTGREQAAGAAPEGYDAESVELDRQVKARMLEHPTESYTTALDAVLATQES
jgi:phage I-like protein